MVLCIENVKIVVFTYSPIKLAIRWVERSRFKIIKKAKLEHVIQNHLYHHHFQPIIDIHNSKALGHEGLLRSEYVDNPESLFRAAIKSNSLFELDISSMKKAIHSFNKQLNNVKLNTNLFINIYPSTLASPHFVKTLINTLETTFILPNRIVIEINEAEKIKNFQLLKTNVRQLKSIGIQIALDDFDNGNITFIQALELEPDYIKIDKYFSENLANSIKKQTIIKSLLNNCSTNNIKVILEGIEMNSDLETAKALGIDYGQGYLIGRPDLFIGYADRFI